MRIPITFAAVVVGLFALSPVTAAAQCGECDSDDGGKSWHCQGSDPNGDCDSAPFGIYCSSCDGPGAIALGADGSILFATEGGQSPAVDETTPELIRHNCTGAIVRRSYDEERAALLRQRSKTITI